MRYYKARWVQINGQWVKFGPRSKLIAVKVNKPPEELNLLEKAWIKIKTWFIVAIGRGYILYYPREYTLKLQEEYMRLMGWEDDDA